MKRSRVGKAKAAGKGPQASEPLAGDEAQRLRAIIESAEGVHTLGGEELLRALKADRPCDSKSCKVGGGGAAAAGGCTAIWGTPSAGWGPDVQQQTAVCCSYLQCIMLLPAAAGAPEAGPPTARNRHSRLPAPRS